jgi:hypothetical protein
MGKFVDLTGQMFGRLTVVERVGRNPRNLVLWKCKCECGGEKITAGIRLTTSVTKSCGCLNLVSKREQRGSANYSFKHGQRGTLTYASWVSMKTRCFNPNHHNYPQYGGRGITVCDRWRGEHGFENFLSDLGERPENTTLDRKEVNGNYEPSNCRWSSPSVQVHNQRKRAHRLSQFRGVTKSGKKFRAYIKRTDLGTFESEQDAAKAYNEAAKRCYGELAHLNEIPETIAA